MGGLSGVSRPEYSVHFQGSGLSLAQLRKVLERAEMFVNNVTAGIAKSVEDLASGRKLRVVGDGKVEPEIADRFQSSSFVDSVEDRRLTKFMAKHAEIRDSQLPKVESEKQLQEAIADTLGQEWSLSELYTYGGEQGVARLDLKLNEPGTGEQVLYLENREREPEFRLTTTLFDEGWKLTHHIEARQGAQSRYTESGRLDGPR